MIRHGPEESAAAIEPDGDEYLRSVRDAVHFMRTEQEFFDRLPGREVQSFETARTLHLDLRRMTSFIDQDPQHHGAVFPPPLRFLRIHRWRGAQVLIPIGFDRRG